MEDQRPLRAVPARELRLRDLGYAGFLAVGLVQATAFLLRWTPTSGWFYRTLAPRFAFPGAVVLVVGAILGAALALALPRERRLLLLAGSTALLPVVLWASVRWSAVAELAAPIYFVGLTMLTLALPADWFLRRRRRAVRAFGVRASRDGRRPR